MHLKLQFKRIHVLSEIHSTVQIHLNAISDADSRIVFLI